MTEMINVGSPNLADIRKMQELLVEHQRKLLRHLVTANLNMKAAERSGAAFYLGMAMGTLRDMVGHQFAVQDLRGLAEDLLGNLEQCQPGLHAELGHPLTLYIGPRLAP